MPYLDENGLARFWLKIKNALSKKQDTLTAGDGIEIGYHGGALTISATPQAYSTEEIRIGTWIDGKPLYKRTFVTTTPTKTESAIEVATASEDNSIDVWNIYGLVQWGPKQMMPINWYPDNIKELAAYSLGISCYFRRGKIIIGCQAGMVGKPAYITLEYTKATD